MKKVTVNEFIIDFGNRIYRYKAVDVPFGTDCSQCDLNVIKTHQVNDLKALACDKYACVAGLRTDKRNIVFKEKK